MFKGLQAAAARAEASKNAVVDIRLIGHGCLFTARRSYGTSERLVNPYLVSWEELSDTSYQQLLIKVIESLEAGLDRAEASKE